MLYGRVAEEATDLRAKLDAALADRGEGAEALLHREITVDNARRRLAALGAAESGLCFGAMSAHTAEGDEKTYLGRIGVFDDDEPDPLLLDWRAPAARPFYCATSRTPMGIHARRHFQCSRHRLTAVSEEFLDADHAVDAALSAALDAPRTERMRDIVSTIQADQDAIIRARSSGILVIDGGPGTGKTSVALHRIAYLLYAEAERLERRGVLMIGPNTRFLRYVSQVLPSLGETGVAFATPGELYPGLAATAPEPAAVRTLKGATAMLDVLARAVADRQELPPEPVAIALDDVTVHLDTAITDAARTTARDTGLLHNPARSVFLRTVVERLTARAVDTIGADLLDPSEVDAIRGEVIAAPALAVASDALWPRLTPQRLLAELYASPERIAAATPDWTDADRALLHRTTTAWTEADAALLDEAEELLGVLAPIPRAEPEPDPDDIPNDPENEREYAEGVLQILNHDLADDAEEQVRVVDLLEAGALAGRQEVRDTRTVAERALADRTWTFGHVVVDEAQELSPMQWRVLHRRCPNRSMTVAGDLAQGTAGTTAWADVFPTGSWRPRTLRTNYRVPAPVMTLAAAAAPGVTPPDSPRDGEKPWRLAGPATRETLDALVDAELAAVAPGLVAVIAEDPPALTAREGLSVLTPTAAKGLEFDAVIVLEPQRIALAADRYVALTRPTRHLGLVHTDPLPAEWEHHTVPR